MIFKLTLNKAELEELSVEHPTSTVELFPCNDSYGHATVLKQYCGLSQDYVLPGVIPHGASFLDRVIEIEKTSVLPLVLVMSKQQQAVYGRHCRKPSFVIGNPFYYASRMIGSELAEIRKNAAGTIVFPNHSTGIAKVDFDQLALIKYLKQLPADYHPIHVCEYWKDIQHGRHQMFLEAGFGCTTAGFMLDQDFLFRLLRIIVSHRYAVVNALGDAALFAAVMGLPVLIFNQEFTNSCDDPPIPKGESPPSILPLWENFLRTASLPIEQAARIQKQLAEEALGYDSLMEPSELKALLRTCWQKIPFGQRIKLERIIWLSRIKKTWWWQLLRKIKKTILAQFSEEN